MIKAKNIPDACFQAWYEVIRNGRRFKIDSGSFAGAIRIELDFLHIHIDDPSYGSGTQDIIPNMPESSNIVPPVTLDYLYGKGMYAYSLLDDEKHENETYTYGYRLRYVIDQISHIVGTLRETPRTNQMVLRFSRPEDILLEDPPCLNSIFCRVQDGKLNFHIYFRSNDLWSGFPANMAAIEFLQKTMAMEIGIAQGSFDYTCSGAHIYDYAESIVTHRIGGV